MVIALSIIANPNNWVAVPAPAATNGPTLYQSGGRHRTISAALALGSVGIVVAGLMTALVAPEVIPFGPPIIEVTHVPLPVPPEPDPQPDAPRHDPVLTTPRPKLDIPITTEGPVIVDPIDFTIPTLGGIGSGGGAGDINEIVTPPPLFTAARRNPRFASSFQPPYPAALQREGVEGRCPVSVTIAPSGRVSAVRDMGCTDPAFFRATQNQALNRWRFEPATRNGVAMESRLTQTVVFRIDQ